MQATRLRAKAHGLIPAGAYFADIAEKLEGLNARETALQEDLAEEDHALEAMYRKRSGARVAAPAARHAMM